MADQTDVVRGMKEPNRDILSQVVIGEEIAERWQKKISSEDTRSKLMSLHPAEIPEEKARIEPDGSLTIYVLLPSGRGEIAIRVPAERWNWKQ